MSKPSVASAASRAGAPRVLVYVADPRQLEARAKEPEPPPLAKAAFRDSSSPAQYLPAHRNFLYRTQIEQSDQRHTPNTIYYKSLTDNDGKVASYATTDSDVVQRTEFFTVNQQFLKETGVKVDDGSIGIDQQHVGKRDCVNLNGVELAGVEAQFRLPVEAREQTTYQTRFSEPSSESMPPMQTVTIRQGLNQFDACAVQEGTNRSDRDLGKNYVNYQILEQSVSHQSIVNQSISILNQQVGVNRGVVGEGDSAGSATLVRADGGVLLAVLPSPAPEAEPRTATDVQTVTVPLGWRRIINGATVIYVSPSGTALATLPQLREYLQTSGTCKCGLPCPLRPELAFSFDPKVSSKPSSPTAGADLPRLCNHKRKLLLALQARAAHSSPPQHGDSTAVCEVGLLKKKMKKRSFAAAPVQAPMQSQIQTPAAAPMSVSVPAPAIVHARDRQRDFKTHDEPMSRPLGAEGERPAAHYLTVSSGWISQHEGPPQPQSSGICQPSSGICQPSTGTCQPSSGICQPSSGICQPSSGIIQPSSGIGQPSTGICQPSSGICQPSSGIIQPSSGICQPQSGIGQMPSGICQSPSGVQPPSGILQPSGVAQMPSGVVQPSSGMGQMPSGMSPMPSGVGQMPSVVRPADSAPDEEAQIFCGLNQPLTPEVMQKINEQQQIFIQQNQKQIELAMKGFRAQQVANSNANGLAKGSPAKTPPWQLKRPAPSPSPATDDSHTSPINQPIGQPVGQQVCPRVPPLPQHYNLQPQQQLQQPQWVDGGRRKVKTGRGRKKGSPERAKDECSESPSFMDDPNAYMAQQTAMLHHTIARRSLGDAGAHHAHAGANHAHAGANHAHGGASGHSHGQSAGNCHNQGSSTNGSSSNMNNQGNNGNIHSQISANHNQSGFDTRCLPSPSPPIQTAAVSTSLASPEPPAPIPYRPPPHLGTGITTPLAYFRRAPLLTTTVGAPSLTRDTLTCVLAGRACTTTSTSGNNRTRPPADPSAALAIPADRPDPFLSTVNLPTSYPLHIAQPIAQQTTTARRTPGQILISSTGQIIVSSPSMPPPPPKVSTNQGQVLVTPFDPPPGHHGPPQMVSPSGHQGPPQMVSPPNEVKAGQSFSPGVALLSPESLKKRTKRKQMPTLVSTPGPVVVHPPLSPAAGPFSPRGFLSPPSPVLQTLTLVPNKGHLVMNQSPQINLLQPVNLINNIPFQQFLVPNLGGVMMTADGAIVGPSDGAPVQLQLQTVHGQSVLTPVPPLQVLRHKMQHSPTQFLSPPQQVVNFGGQLSPLLSNLSPPFAQPPVRQQVPSQELLMVPLSPKRPSLPPPRNSTFVQNTTIVQQQTTLVASPQLPLHNQSPTPPRSSPPADVPDGSSNPDGYAKFLHEFGQLLNVRHSVSTQTLQQQRKSPNGSPPDTTTHSPLGALDPTSPRRPPQAPHPPQPPAPPALHHAADTTTRSPEPDHGASAMVQCVSSSEQDMAEALARGSGSNCNSSNGSGSNCNSSNGNGSGCDNGSGSTYGWPKAQGQHDFARDLDAHTHQHNMLSNIPMLRPSRTPNPAESDSPFASLSCNSALQHMMPMTLYERPHSHPPQGYKRKNDFGDGSSYRSDKIMRTNNGLIHGMPKEPEFEAADKHTRLFSSSSSSDESIQKVFDRHLGSGDDSDVSDEVSPDGKRLARGDVVWAPVGAGGGSLWPAQLVGRSNGGWRVRCFGGPTARALQPLPASRLLTLSEGLEAHHAARSSRRKSRKLNTLLENAIQEAMAELDKKSERANETTEGATVADDESPTAAASATASARRKRPGQPRRERVQRARGRTRPERDTARLRNAR